MAETITPTSFQEAADALSEAAGSGRPVRFAGGGTKLGWGLGGPRNALRVSLSRLDRTLDHSPADLSATFEAGARLVSVQAELARHGQMLALDPPAGLADGSSATLGGIFATADSGPLSHAHGTPRDVVLGMTVLLGDGTVAKSGGQVMKNVAGYDIPRLFTGSFGTLGAILSVSVRLQPLPPESATVLGATEDPKVLRAIAIALNGQPLELQALDFAWRNGQGGLLAQVAGADVSGRAERIGALMGAGGMRDVEVQSPDAHLWTRQRGRQRSGDRAVVRVDARPTDLGAILKLVDQCEATAVGRAGLGVAYLTMNVNQVVPLRSGLPAGASAVVQDLPVSARGAVDPWGGGEGPELELMRAVKRRFDTAGICNPGIFVGGI